MADHAIAVRGLRKSYGGTVAVDRIDLTVATGECFAFLGPNGAGKTTAVEILEGFRDRDAGEVEVLGVDPLHAGRSWRARIGVVLQECAVIPELSVRESLAMFARYYDKPRPVDEVIEAVGLTAETKRPAGKLSGGQQRRLDVGLALVGDPELLFLDEPTTGFDPTARRKAWEMIGSLKALDKTVFLTTHYLEEAERLADRVAVINRGRIVASGTPADLVARSSQRTRISFTPPAYGRAFPDGMEARIERNGDEWALDSDQPVADLAELCGWAVARGVDLANLTVTRPNLEDVYLALVGPDA